MTVGQSELRLSAFIFLFLSKDNDGVLYIKDQGC